MEALRNADRLSCAHTDYECDCDCKCPEGMGPKACNWPECECACTVDCAGCNLLGVEKF